MAEINYAAVAVFRPVHSTFEYSVPKGLREEVEAGSICSVPFRGERERGVVIETSDEPSFSGERKAIGKVLSRQPLKEPILELARWLSGATFTPLGQVFKRMIPADLSIRPRMKKSIELVSSFEEVRVFVEEEGRQAPKQAEILKQLLTADGPMEKKELLDRAGSSRSPLNSLLKRGFIGEISLPVVENSEWKIPEGFELAAQDLSCPEELDGFSGSFEEYAIYSTERERLARYLELIRLFARDGSVLVLAPDVLRSRELAGLIEKELDLTSLTYHSELTRGEISHRWQLARRGGVDVVVGVLSAVYLPLSGLKGILVEDEGNRNYELQEQDPKGNLVETALKRGELEDVPVILGGPTPSINTYYRLQKGEFRELGNNSSHFPAESIELDLGTPNSASSDRTLSKGLLSALEENYSRGEPALIVGERAGPSSAAICQECGAVLRCPNCQVPLAYRSSGNYTICPYCGEKEDIVDCQNCGSDEVKFIGGGLGEVERELNSYLPMAEVRSYDSKAEGPNYFFRSVRDLINGDVDILIGTSLIGSLFLGEKLPLVGLLDLDLLLNRATYRSTEFLARRVFKGYELVKPGGRIYLDGFRADQAPFELIKAENWERLYERELESRQLMGYPPCRELIEIEVRGSDPAEVGERIDDVKRQLRELVPEADVLGPTEEHPATGTGDGARSYLMVKTEDLADLLDVLGSIFPRSERRNIRLNPYL